MTGFVYGRLSRGAVLLISVAQCHQPAPLGSLQAHLRLCFQQADGVSHMFLLSASCVSLLFQVPPARVLACMPDPLLCGD